MSDVVVVPGAAGEPNDALAEAVRTALEDPRLKGTYKDLIQKLDNARSVAYNEGRRQACVEVLAAAEVEYDDGDPAVLAMDLASDLGAMADLEQFALTVAQVVSGEADPQVLIPTEPLEEDDELGQIAAALGLVLVRVKELLLATEGAMVPDAGTMMVPPAMMVPPTGTMAPATGTAAPAVQVVACPPCKGVAGHAGCPLCRGWGSVAVGG